MYCVLEYIDYRAYKRLQNESLSTLKSLHSNEADPNNLALYFNPNCLLQLILEYICTEAHVNTDSDNYDICSGTGELLKIRDYLQTTSGLSIFYNQEVYYIVILKRDANTNEIDEIVPLLSPYTDIYYSLKKSVNRRYVALKQNSSVYQKKTSFSGKRSSKGSNASATNSRGRRRSSAT